MRPTACTLRGCVAFTLIFLGSALVHPAHAGPVPIAVPEPAGLTLLGVGLAGLAGLLLPV